MTIESIMCIGIGFLFAGLIGVAVMPLVHGRAVRLTTRRLEGALPKSMAEIQADKDLLRAEFAISIRRLEMTVEQLKNKTTRQLADLGKKSDVINRLKIERDALKVEIISLKSQIEAAAFSTKMSEQPSLAPFEPTIRQSIQGDTWTRDESISDASIVPTFGRSDTWARGESEVQSMQEDTWTRDESTGDPSDPRYTAFNRPATARPQQRP